jgi:DNA-binding beta-propeller fold protein YncE
MKKVILVLGFSALALRADTINFGSDTPGTVPKGWSVFMTHPGGAPKWEVVADKTAPSKKPYVVGQTSQSPDDNRFPLLIYDNSNVKDGEVSVSFKPISGKIDQGAGVVWRYQNPDTYYIARCNALEDNCVLYKVEKSQRIPLPPVGQPLNTYGIPHHVPTGVWSTLRVTFKDSLFSVYVNGERIFDVDDKTFTEAGKVGLWTKSDSAMYFDNFAFANAPATGGYHLSQTVPVGGVGVVGVLSTMDSASRRLYVSHNTEVDVIDLDSGKVVGKIDKMRGVRAVAIASDLGRGFTSNGQGATSTIFDLKTLEIIGEVKTGPAPTQMVYDPATKRVFTFNRRGYSMTAIEAQEGTVSGTVELDARPEFAVTDGKGHLLVSLWEKEAILPVDARKLAAAGEPWKAGTCERPTSMALDQKNARLFVGCANRMLVVLDANSGHLITKVPTSLGRAATVAFDPQARLIFSSNGDGTNSEGAVTVIRQDSADKYSALETVKIGAGARAVAVDEKTHSILVPFADQATSEMGSGGGDIRYKPDTFRILVFGK